MSKFETKSSGEKVKFSTGMHRNKDDSKPRYDLITPLDMKVNMIDRWAALMANGCKLFGDRNWELASTQEEFDRFMESAERHFHQWKKQVLGIYDDGEDHLAALYFNSQGVEYVKERLLKDENDGH